MPWANNGWVIGIATGIVSGLLVTWIARLFLSKKDNREYQQKISAANREVIYAIRPGISEGQVPDDTIIRALTAATARRYGVSASELLNPSNIAEELIKEVMDSTFISAAKKIEYCNQLKTIGVEEIDKILNTLDDPHAVEKRMARRRRTIGSVSAILGILTGIGTLLAALAESMPELHPFNRERVMVLFVSPIAVVVGLLAIYVFWRRREEQLEFRLFEQQVENIIESEAKKP